MLQIISNTLFRYILFAVSYSHIACFYEYRIASLFSFHVSLPFPSPLVLVLLQCRHTSYSFCALVLALPFNYICFFIHFFFSLLLLHPPLSFSSLFSVSPFTIASSVLACFSSTPIFPHFHFLIFSSCSSICFYFHLLLLSASFPVYPTWPPHHCLILSPRLPLCSSTHYLATFSSLHYSSATSSRCKLLSTSITLLLTSGFYLPDS